MIPAVGPKPRVWTYCEKKNGSCTRFGGSGIADTVSTGGVYTHLSILLGRT